VLRSRRVFHGTISKKSGVRRAGLVRSARGHRDAGLWRPCGQRRRLVLRRARLLAVRRGARARALRAEGGRVHRRALSSSVSHALRRRRHNAGSVRRRRAHLQSTAERQGGSVDLHGHSHLVRLGVRLPALAAAGSEQRALLQSTIPVELHRRLLPLPRLRVRVGLTRSGRTRARAQRTRREPSPSTRSGWSETPNSTSSPSRTGIWRYGPSSQSIASSILLWTIRR